MIVSHARYTSWFIQTLLWIHEWKSGTETQYSPRSGVTIQYQQDGTVDFSGMLEVPRKDRPSYPTADNAKYWSVFRSWEERTLRYDFPGIADLVESLRTYGFAVDDQLICAVIHYPATTKLPIYVGRLNRRMTKPGLGIGAE